MSGAEPPQEWPAPIDPHPSSGGGPAVRQAGQPPYPAHATSHTPAGHRNVAAAQHPWMHGTEREYLLALILTVVTLGIYHFYYHYKTHDELCAQLGRPNDIKPLFIAYVIVMVGSATIALAPLGLVAGMVLLGFIVVRQYAAIHDARRRLGLMPRGDATTFLLWDYLGALILVGPFIAYYNMVQNYNDIWGTLRHGGHLASDDGMGQAPGGTAAPHASHGAIGGGTPGSGGYLARSPPAQRLPAPPEHAAADATVGGSRLGSPSHVADTAEASSRPGPAFSIRDRHEPAAAHGLVDQRFSCPRCLAHVSVRGTEGELVPVRCGACGETGEVRIGD